MGNTNSSSSGKGNFDNIQNNSAINQTRDKQHCCTLL